MTESPWMTEAIRMIQEHGNQRDPIERARMEIAIYQHLKEQRNAVLEEAANIATSFLVGDPANGIPLRNPMAHEIADAIRSLKQQP